MKRNDWILLCIHMVLGALLLTAGRLLLADGGGRSGSLELEPFHSVDLQVLSADVTIEPGEDYSLSYNLHGRENVKRAEVVDGTLYFDTGFDPMWQPGGGAWSVVLTVPADSSFDALALRSTAGEILISGWDFRDGSFTTTAGEVTVSQAACDSLSVETVSHDISVTDSTVAQAANLKTVSGSILVEAPFETIRAESVGKIHYNGAEQGRTFAIGQGGPSLEASSVSGRIRLETE